MWATAKWVSEEDDHWETATGDKMKDTSRTLPSSVAIARQLDGVLTSQDKLKKGGACEACESPDDDGAENGTCHSSAAASRRDTT